MVNPQMTTEATTTNPGSLSDLALLCGIELNGKTDNEIISQVYYITKNFRNKVTEITEKQAFEIARWKDMYQTLVKTLLDNNRQGLTQSPS